MLHWAHGESTGSYGVVVDHHRAARDVATAGVVGAVGSVAGVSGAGIMSGLASAGGLVGGGAAMGPLALALGPAAVSIGAVRWAAQGREPAGGSERRATRRAHRIGGGCCGGRRRRAGRPPCGGVAGTSAVGISSWSAAIGGLVGGGGMVARTVAVAA